MFCIRHLCFFLSLAFTLAATAANTNSIIWRSTTDKVSADLHGERLWPLLEDIAHQTGWNIFVEPDTERTVDVKFKDLSSGDALKMLMGDLNFALVPQTNAPARLYVFRTTMKSATRQVRTAKPVKRIANELLIRVKPGTDIDALAKKLGAKVVGRLDKLGLYRLQFDDAAATDAALTQLKTNSDVTDVDYNYVLDPPPSAVPLSSAPVPPLSLTLNPPPDSGKVIVGLVDMNVQSLGSQLDKFILPQLSVSDGTTPAGSDMTHGTAMAYTILEAIAQQSSGGSSVQIQPVDVYGGSESTTSWLVALGIQKAVDNGANVLNLSLGSANDSTVLNGIIQSALANNIMVFGAAGNQPVNTPTYPAATAGVYAITALSQPGQLASYANYWPGDSMALPGMSVVYYGGQPFGVQGTSTATAYASGIYAGLRSASGSTSAQIIPAMQARFPVPHR
ncbi:MAG: S8 family serine peptidase [Limisphaerales bacterium]